MLTREQIHQMTDEQARQYADQTKPRIERMEKVIRAFKITYWVSTIFLVFAVNFIAPGQGLFVAIWGSYFFLYLIIAHLFGEGLAVLAVIVSIAYSIYYKYQYNLLKEEHHIAWAWGNINIDKK